ncbi:steroid C26-monooxygenase Cyp142 [soil metagenome]
MATTCPMKPADFVHNSAEVMECPYPFYTALRDNAPVYQDPQTGYFIVSTYPLVSKVLRTHQIFSSDVMDISPLPPKLREVFVPTKSLLLADQPVHTRHKALVSKALSPARIKALHAPIASLVEQLIDGFIDDGYVDFFERFAMPLPLAVIADQLGVPRSYGAKFREWSDAMVIPMAPSATMAMREAIVPTLTEMNDFFGRIFLEKRANPTDDIISDLATIEIEPIPGVDAPGTPRRLLTLIEGQTIIQLLMVAGNESSTAALCAYVEQLIRNPALATRLRADPSLIRPAVDEVLRIESPLQGFWRLATQDTELGDVAIPKGSLLFVSYAAANRDEEQFADAPRIDLDRKNLNSHLVFGTGIHFCPGATLARTELEIAIAALLQRMDNIRFAPGAETLSHFPTTMVRGLTGLHISFDKIA